MKRLSSESTNTISGAFNIDIDVVAGLWNAEDFSACIGSNSGRVARKVQSYAPPSVLVA